MFAALFLKNNFSVVVLVVDFAVLLNPTVELFVLALLPLLLPLLVKYQLELRERLFSYDKLDRAS